MDGSLAELGSELFLEKRRSDTIGVLHKNVDQS